MKLGSVTFNDGEVSSIASPSSDPVDIVRRLHRGRLTRIVRLDRKLSGIKMHSWSKRTARFSGDPESTETMDGSIIVSVVNDKVLGLNNGKLMVRL